MNKILNRFEPGLLIVFVATTLAVWPFLSRPSLPTDTDAEIHIFRADVFWILNQKSVKIAIFPQDVF